MTWQRMSFSEPIGIQRRLGAVEHHQQLGLVGMQPREQAIEGDEAGAAAEDAIEPRPQCEAAAFLGVSLVCLESGIEVPDHFTHLLLGGTIVIGEGVQLVHQPFGMHPAERMAAHGELPGIPRVRLRRPEGRLAQHHGIAQEAVRVDAAPDRPFGGDLHRIGS